ncbi:MAG: polymerase, sigma-24 subunit, subfamily [Ilumatobacteraceae bacterium]|nr:polymerase, sigma-24 subunit, subfamily [Ilumatobacteraceae bacterium]
MTDADPLRALLDAAVEGDGVAVAELVRRTQPIVWSVCRALGTPGEEADLVQETYLRALSSLGTYRGEAPPRAWLLSIARRVCADHVRRRQRQRRLIDKIGRHTDTASTPATDNVDDLLAALHPDRRDAFLLTQYAGLGYEEAADVLGCPVGTIRSRVSRARADLLAALFADEA